MADLGQAILIPSWLISLAASVAGAYFYSKRRNGGADNNWKGKVEAKLEAVVVSQERLGEQVKETITVLEKMMTACRASSEADRRRLEENLRDLHQALPGLRAEALAVTRDLATWTRSELARLDEKIERNR